VQYLKTNKEILKELWTEHPKEFLQSWFDSDGSIVTQNRKNTLSLSNSKSGWLKFAKQLLHEKFGIEMNFYHNRHLKSGKDQWTLQTGSREMIQKFHTHIGFLINRKQRTLESIILE
jgi:intein-encoded DNA endonuclease-like protein